METERPFPEGPPLEPLGDETREHFVSTVKDLLGEHRHVELHDYVHDVSISVFKNFSERDGVFYQLSFRREGESDRLVQDTLVFIEQDQIALDEEILKEYKYLDNMNKKMEEEERFLKERQRLGLGAHEPTEGRAKELLEFLETARESGRK